MLGRPEHRGPPRASTPAPPQRSAPATARTSHPPPQPQPPVAESRWREAKRRGNEGATGLEARVLEAESLRLLAGVPVGSGERRGSAERVRYSIADESQFAGPRLEYLTTPLGQTTKFRAPMLSAVGVAEACHSKVPPESEKA